MPLHAAGYDTCLNSEIKQTVMLIVCESNNNHIVLCNIIWNLLTTISTQLIWHGHVERMDPMRLPKIMINWKPEGRKKQGCPRRTRKDGIYTAISERYKNG